LTAPLSPPCIFARNHPSSPFPEQFTCSRSRWLRQKEHKVSGGIAPFDGGGRRSSSRRIIIITRKRRTRGGSSSGKGRQGRVKEGALTGLGRGGVPEVAGGGGVGHLEVPALHARRQKRQCMKYVKRNEAIWSVLRFCRER